MAPRNRQNPLVREFILRNVAEHPNDIGALAINKFGLSRTAINRYVVRLIDEDLIVATGKTKARRYELKNFADVEFRQENITRLLDEDVIWRYKILPHIHDLNQNVKDICQYCFTEILNNVIDHSLSDDALISYQQNYCNISMSIADTGVGIFEKIQKDFNLADPRSALFELSKGKLTSDKKRHSGEGIFYTSRMLDRFQIRSGNLCYSRVREDGDDWLIETGHFQEHLSGTTIIMNISTDALWTTRSVFDEYQKHGFKFRKTHVPISLGNYPGEQLVSRSQAKRVLARFDQFSEVILDFQGVDDIGQPFADEIFRVFQNSHPEIRIVAFRTNENIDKMIKYVSHREDYS